MCGGTSASNIEGAGVIDAGFCYQVARNGRRTQFDATSENTTFTYNVYCDYKTLPFRIACAWDVVSTDLVTQKVDFDLYVYKDGVLVAASMAYANSDTYAVTNYEIVELSTEILSEYGVGYYQVEITSFESFDLNENIRIGLAWEQR